MSDNTDVERKKNGFDLLIERLQPISTAEMNQILRVMPPEKSLEDDEPDSARKLTTEERLAILRETLAPLTTVQIDELAKIASTLPVQQAAAKLTRKEANDEPDGMEGGD